jgi:signal transduction histidine kinase
LWRMKLFMFIIKPLSLHKKTYILVTVVTTLAFLFAGYFHAQYIKDKVYAEKERTLIKIVMMLAEQLPKPYQEILLEEGAAAYSEEEKRKVLRKRLQPIIDQIEQQFPGYLIKYGDYNYVIAAPAQFPLVATTRVGRAPYIQKTMVTSINAYSPTWRASSMSVAFPLTVKGAVYGHAEASVKLAEVEEAYCNAWRDSTIVFLAIWLASMLLLRQLFKFIEMKLAILSEQIENQNDTREGLRDFPQLEPVLDTVIRLREKLKKQSDLREKILESISDCFFLLDRDMHFEYLNPGAVQYFKKDLTGKSIWEERGTPSPFYENFNQAALEHEPVSFEAFDPLAGSWVDVAAYPLNEGLAVFFIVIDQKRELQKQLARLEELNIVSKLAASISHEVRNPLTSVRGFLQLLGRKPDTQHYRAYFELMIEELDRANTIIEEFLSTVRQSGEDKELISLNAILTKLQPILEADALKNDQQIELVLESIPDISVSRRKIKQMILNFVRNAFEAMEKKGVLIIKTFQENGCVVLAIQDTGQGIPPEILAHIGKPFLTTKDQGTGLGLAVCYNIAAEHDAAIHVETGPGGTTFLIRFPVPAELSGN